MGSEGQGAAHGRPNTRFEGTQIGRCSEHTGVPRIKPDSVVGEFHGPRLPCHRACIVGARARQPPPGHGVPAAMAAAPMGSTPGTSPCGDAAKRRRLSPSADEASGWLRPAPRLAQQAPAMACALRVSYGRGLAAAGLMDLARLKERSCGAPAGCASSRCSVWRTNALTRGRLLALCRPVTSPGTQVTFTCAGALARGCGARQQRKGGLTAQPVSCSWWARLPVRARVTGPQPPSTAGEQPARLADQKKRGILQHTPSPGTQVWGVKEWHPIVTRHSGQIGRQLQTFIKLAT